MSRVDRIKKKYVESGAFKEDSPAFKAGVSIVYEMEEDYRAMVAAVEYIDNFIEYKKLGPKTFGDQELFHARERLQKRIDEYG